MYRYSDVLQSVREDRVNGTYLRALALCVCASAGSDCGKKFGIVKPRRAQPALHLSQTPQHRNYRYQSCKNSSRLYFL